MANKELTIKRIFDAPRETVFKHWTDEKLLVKWWGPNGATNPTCEWDARPGGKINIVMLAGKELGPLAGQEWPMTGEVKEVVSPKKLVYKSNAIMNGKTVLETLTTVTLEEQDDQTKMMVHIVVTMTTPEAEGPLAGMEIGWNQQIDKLAEVLKDEN